jgi:hypothetical protein
MSAVAISHGGVMFRHGGLVCTGTVNTIVPFTLPTFGYALTPKLIVFVVSLKPVPTIVTRMPTEPARGCTKAIAGTDEGAMLLALHADSAIAAKHVQPIVRILNVFITEWRLAPNDSAQLLTTQSKNRVAKSGRSTTSLLTGCPDVLTLVTGPRKRRGG